MGVARLLIMGSCKCYSVTLAAALSTRLHSDMNIQAIALAFALVTLTMSSPLSRVRRQTDNEVALRRVAITKSKPELLSAAVSQADPDLLRVALTHADPKLLEVALTRARAGLLGTALTRSRSDTLETAPHKLHPN